MNINTLILYNYRNYKQLKLKLSSNINIFTGYNAQGKTNIIEAVHLASIGISHRTRNESDLILWGSEKSQISISFSKKNITSNLKISLKKHTRKELNFNGEIKKQKDLPGLLTMILFSPEDLMLIKGTPQLRRRFLDIELSQISSLYYNSLVQYNKILLQRNNLLKKIRENNQLIDMLDIWDKQLAQISAFIVEKRLRGIDKLSILANKTHNWISKNKEDLQIIYNLHNSSGVIEKDVQNLNIFFQEALKKYRNKDIYRGTTSIGPHRDDIDFYINNVSLKSFGSQGQQRSCILSLKLAELEFLKDETGEYPVLLLDDVMSELDENRRKNLLSLLQEKNIQTLITATDTTLFSIHPKNKFFKVDKGLVSEEL